MGIFVVSVYAIVITALAIKKCSDFDRLSVSAAKRYGRYDEEILRLRAENDTIRSTNAKLNATLKGYRTAVNSLVVDTKVAEKKGERCSSSKRS